MNTSFTDIYSRFSMKVTDFNLDKIYLDSISLYNDYVKGFLISGISKFTQCNQDLSNRNNDTQMFNIVLTDLEQEILASMMVVEWCSKEVHSIMELRRFLNDTDFKMFSESQNLREKNSLLITTRESTDKLITQYGYATLDFSLLGG